MNSQEKKDLPLVSIVVITYNSSQYVLETLNSAYRQTYAGPIELIISDDCSLDDTVEICRNWLDKQSSRFQRTLLLTAERNEGVSKNINRGCREAKGEWIKPIAGDDILLDECLSCCYIETLSVKDTCGVIMGGLLEFSEQEQILHPETMKPQLMAAPGSIINFEYIYKRPFLATLGPAFFIRHSILKQIGYFDEEYRNYEDYPFIRRLVAAGFHSIVIPAYIVYYRGHQTSITSRELQKDTRVYEFDLDVCDKYITPRLGFIERYNFFWETLPIRCLCHATFAPKWLVSLVYRLKFVFQTKSYRV